MNQWLVLLLLIVINLVVSFLIGASMSKSVKSNWYESLKKSPLNPPNTWFGVVWFTLYVLIAIAGWLIWKKEPSLLWIYFLGLALNFIWSPIFFNSQNIAIGLLVIFLLWISIIYSIYRFYPVSKVAAYLFIPYLLWVTFATYLNYYIWANN